MPRSSFETMAQRMALVYGAVWLLGWAVAPGEAARAFSHMEEHWSSQSSDQCVVHNSFGVDEAHNTLSDVDLAVKVDEDMGLILDGQFFQAEPGASTMKRFVDAYRAGKLESRGSSFFGSESMCDEYFRSRTLIGDFDSFIISGVAHVGGDRLAVTAAKLMSAATILDGQGKEDPDFSLRYKVDVESYVANDPNMEIRKNFTEMELNPENYGLCRNNECPRTRGKISNIRENFTIVGRMKTPDVAHTMLVTDLLLWPNNPRPKPTTDVDRTMVVEDSYIKKGFHILQWTNTGWMVESAANWECPLCRAVGRMKDNKLMLGEDSFANFTYKKTPKPNGQKEFCQSNHQRIVSTTSREYLLKVDWTHWPGFNGFVETTGCGRSAAAMLLQVYSYIDDTGTDPEWIVNAFPWYKPLRPYRDSDNLSFEYLTYLLCQKTPTPPPKNRVARSLKEDVDKSDEEMICEINGDRNCERYRYENYESRRRRSTPSATPNNTVPEDYLVLNLGVGSFLHRLYTETREKLEGITVGAYDAALFGNETDFEALLAKYDVRDGRSKRSPSDPRQAAEAEMNKAVGKTAPSLIGRAREWTRKAFKKEQLPPPLPPQSVEGAAAVPPPMIFSPPLEPPLASPSRSASFHDWDNAMREMKEKMKAKSPLQEKISDATSPSRSSEYSALYRERAERLAAGDTPGMINFKKRGSSTSLEHAPVEKRISTGSSSTGDFYDFDPRYGIRGITRQTSLTRSASTSTVNSAHEEEFLSKPRFLDPMTGSRQAGMSSNTRPYPRARSVSPQPRRRASKVLRERMELNNQRLRRPGIATVEEEGFIYEGVKGSMEPPVRDIPKISLPVQPKPILPVPGTSQGQVPPVPPRSPNLSPKEPNRLPLPPRSPSVSPHGSPRGSPHGSPRGSPRGSPNPPRRPLQRQDPMEAAGGEGEITYASIRIAPSKPPKGSKLKLDRPELKPMPKPARRTPNQFPEQLERRLQMNDGSAGEMLEAKKPPPKPLPKSNRFCKRSQTCGVLERPKSVKAFGGGGGGEEWETNGVQNGVDLIDPNGDGIPGLGEGEMVLAGEHTVVKKAPAGAGVGNIDPNMIFGGMVMLSISQQITSNTQRFIDDILSGKYDHVDQDTAITSVVLGSLDDMSASVSQGGMMMAIMGGGPAGIMTAGAGLGVQFLVNIFTMGRSLYDLAWPSDKPKDPLLQHYEEYAELVNSENAGNRWCMTPESRVSITLQYFDKSPHADDQKTHMDWAVTGQTKITVLYNPLLLFNGDLRITCAGGGSLKFDEFNAQTVARQVATLTGGSTIYQVYMMPQMIGQEAVIHARCGEKTALIIERQEIELKNTMLIQKASLGEPLSTASMPSDVCDVFPLKKFYVSFSGCNYELGSSIHVAWSTCEQLFRAAVWNQVNETWMVANPFAPPQSNRKVFTFRRRDFRQDPFRPNEVSSHKLLCKNTDQPSFCRLEMTMTPSDTSSCNNKIRWLRVEAEKAVDLASDVVQGYMLVCPPETVAMYVLKRGNLDNVIIKEMDMRGAVRKIMLTEYGHIVWLFCQHSTRPHFKSDIIELASVRKRRQEPVVDPTALPKTRYYEVQWSHSGLPGISAKGPVSDSHTTHWKSWVAKAQPDNFRFVESRDPIDMKLLMSEKFRKPTDKPTIHFEHRWDLSAIDSHWGSSLWTSFVEKGCKATSSLGVTFGMCKRVGGELDIREVGRFTWSFIDETPAGVTLVKGSTKWTLKAVPSNHDAFKLGRSFPQLMSQCSVSLNIPVRELTVECPTTNIPVELARSHPFMCAVVAPARDLCIHENFACGHRTYEWTDMEAKRKNWEDGSYYIGKIKFLQGLQPMQQPTFFCTDEGLYNPASDDQNKKTVVIYSNPVDLEAPNIPTYTSANVPGPDDRVIPWRMMSQVETMQRQFEEVFNISNAPLVNSINKMAQGLTPEGRAISQVSVGIDRVMEMTQWREQKLQAIQEQLDITTLDMMTTALSDTEWFHRFVDRADKKCCVLSFGDGAFQNPPVYNLSVENLYVDQHTFECPSREAFYADHKVSSRYVMNQGGTFVYDRHMQEYLNARPEMDNRWVTCLSTRDLIFESKEALTTFMEDLVGTMGDWVVAAVEDRLLDVLDLVTTRESLGELYYEEDVFDGDDNVTAAAANLTDAAAAANLTDSAPATTAPGNDSTAAPATAAPANLTADMPAVSSFLAAGQEAPAGNSNVGTKALLVVTVPLAVAFVLMLMFNTLRRSLGKKKKVYRLAPQEMETIRLPEPRV